MRRFLALTAVIVGLGGLTATVAEAAPFGEGVLPKGFPYAAEISATIHYDGTYRRASETDIPCSDGENETTLNETEVDTLHFSRTVFFSHITVPVVNPRALGASAARLALRPTATSTGKIRSDRSTMDFEGSLPIGDPVSEGCHTSKVTCHWDLQGAPDGVSQTIVSRSNGFLPESWFVNVLGSNSFLEDEAGATGEEELSEQLNDAATLYLPIDDESGFPEVAINSQKLVDFDVLRDHEDVTFQQHLLGGTGTESREREVPGPARSPSPARPRSSSTASPSTRPDIAT